MRRVRRTTAFITIFAAALTVSAGLPPASADPAPTVRMFAAADHITLERDRRGFTYLDPGVWIATVGGALELYASRPDYDTPVSLVQTDPATGAVVRELPADLLDPWSGLKDFVHIAVRDPEGHLVLRQPITLCPNSYTRSRISDEGPLTSSYPQFCGGNPFTKGAVFGIDAGWAVSAVGDYGYGLGFRAEARRYHVSMWIDPAWVTALEIAPEDASTTVAGRVVRSKAGDGVPGEPGPGSGGRSIASPYAPSAAVPETTTPPAETLPDLVALPAWGIQSFSRRDHDLLAFNATEWDAGPGTLVVEGFRPHNAETMDAYQYFLEDGVPVARSRVGNLEFHAQHRHWHFEQFTRYTLLDASSGQIQISGKQSWCLANTDALDLSIPNANWAAYGGDLFTMCGGPGAIWIREVLDVGWGDTYGQYLPGQAFDITSVPNGDYYIRVEVNPDDLLYESTTDNNVQDRLIKLRGKPGARYAIVPPWHGIDTENPCQECG